MPRKKGIENTKMVACPACEKECHGDWGLRIHTARAHVQEVAVQADAESNGHIQAQPRKAMTRKRPKSVRGVTQKDGDFVRFAVNYCPECGLPLRVHAAALAVARKHVRR